MRLLFDNSYPLVNESWFKSYSWYDYYRDAKEAISGSMAEKNLADLFTKRLTNTRKGIFIKTIYLLREGINQCYFVVFVLSEGLPTRSFCAVSLKSCILGR